MTSRRELLRRRPLLALVVVLVLAAGVGCTRQDSGPRAPELALATLDDETVNLGDRRGLPLLVAFFAIDNPLALEALGQLDELTAEFRHKGLELVAVALSGERPGLVRTVVHQQQFLFPVAMDPNGAAATAFGGVTATPTVFLVSPDGDVVERTEGRANIAALRATIGRF